MRRPPDEPVRDMQALASSGARAGQAFADAQQTMFKDMAERMSRPWPETAPSPAEHASERAGLRRRRSQAFAQLVVHGERSSRPALTKRLAAAATAAGRPARGRHADQDLRPARLALGDERDRRGAGAAWPRARAWPTSGTPSASSRAVFTAWVALRRRSLEHNTVMLDGWTRAAGRLRQAAERPRRAGRAAARLLARAAGALDRHREPDVPGDAALGGLPQDASATC